MAFAIDPNTSLSLGLVILVIGATWRGSRHMQAQENLLQTVADQNKEQGEKIDKLDAGLEERGKQVTKMVAMLDDVLRRAERMETQLDDAAKRFGTLDMALVVRDGRLVTVENRMDEFGRNIVLQLAGIGNRIDDLNRGIQETRIHYDAEIKILRDRTHALANDFSHMTLFEELRKRKAVSAEGSE